MPLVKQNGRFVSVSGRKDIPNAFKTGIAASAAMMKHLPPYGGLSPASPVEVAYDWSAGYPRHQGFNRAHTVSVRMIEEMVCIYLNGGNFLSFLGKVGALYQPSWVDLLLAPRFAVIYMQYVAAMTESIGLQISLISKAPDWAQEYAANLLVRELCRSIANISLGDSATDQKVGPYINPKRRRGLIPLGMAPAQQTWFESFLAYLQSYDVAQTELNWPSTLAQYQFQQETYKLSTLRGFKLISTPWGGVFSGTVNGTIFMSEELGQRPTPQQVPSSPKGAPQASRPLATAPAPRPFKGLTAADMKFVRFGRNAAQAIGLSLMVGVGAVLLKQAQEQFTFMRRSDGKS